MPKNVVIKMNHIVMQPFENSKLMQKSMMSTILESQMDQLQLCTSTGQPEPPDPLLQCHGCAQPVLRIGTVTHWAGSVFVVRAVL